MSQAIFDSSDLEESAPFSAEDGAGSVDPFEPSDRLADFLESVT